MDKRVDELYELLLQSLREGIDNLNDIVYEMHVATGLSEETVRSYLPFIISKDHLVRKTIAWSERLIDRANEISKRSNELGRMTTNEAYEYLSEVGDPLAKEFDQFGRSLAELEKFSGLSPFMRGEG